MNSAIERLLSFRVSDVMTRNVITLRADSSLAEAAKVLGDNDITGAPVVDGAGRCVGVLSMTDLALRDNRLLETARLFRVASAAVPIGGVEMKVAANESVADCMSPLVQTIEASASIINAARILCRERIHRLVIVDDDQRPVGVVSSLDIIASMVAAVEE
jgi:CBS domain-containing protein